jgi:hypothetical protein
MAPVDKGSPEASVLRRRPHNYPVMEQYKLLEALLAPGQLQAFRLKSRVRGELWLHHHCFNYLALPLARPGVWIQAGNGIKNPNWM